MKNRFIPVLFAILTLAGISSCKKQEDGTLQDVTITIMAYGNPVDLAGDTIFVASDYLFSGKALAMSPDLTRVRYVVLHEGTEVTSTVYTPEPGGTGYQLDSIRLDLDYDLLASHLNNVTLQVEATRTDGAVFRAHTTFKLQPLNYPFQFRFYDFNRTDTLAAGSQVTLLPFYSPLTVDDQISSMKVYRKVGFGAETLVDTFNQGDFYYYGTGYLREYPVTMPSLAPGNVVINRFELLTTKQRIHVIQHTALIQ